MGVCGEIAPHCSCPFCGSGYFRPNGENFPHGVFAIKPQICLPIPRFWWPWVEYLKSETAVLRLDRTGIGCEVGKEVPPAAFLGKRRTTQEL